MRVDADAGAAYVSISRAAVARTEPSSESVLIDVDAAGRPVGIELLTLTATVDVDGIAEKYHLPDDVRAELRRVLGGEGEGGPVPGSVTDPDGNIVGAGCA